MSIILVQFRVTGDSMAIHEQTCVSSRLRGAEMTVLGALQRELDPSRLADSEAVVFGGSGEFGVHDELTQEWLPHVRDFMEEVLSRGVPGFGICFGHQVLGHHLGGSVETNPSLAEIGTREFSLTSDGMLDPVFGAVPQNFWGQTGHSDSVVTPPAGVLRLATSSIHDNQAFKVKGAPFYTAQFHPDLLGQDALERYQAYESTMTSRTERTHEEADLFIPGKDDAAVLLGAFLDWVRAE